MPFSTIERSIQDGLPVYLYAFMVYGVTYRYTSASTDIVFDSQTYLAVEGDLLHTPIDLTTEVAKSNIRITCPHDFPILVFYESAPPSDVILCNIWRHHRGDSEVAQEWSGRIINATRNPGAAELLGESPYTAIKRSGQRRTYSKLCPHVLYGPACGVVDTTKRVTITLDSVVGLVINASILDTYPDDRFAGGVLEWEPTPGRKERRAIKSHVGGEIEITHPIVGLLGGLSVNVFPGCKHDPDDCDGEFDNMRRYGGFQHVPRQNPMGNTSVF